mgnify:FL=1
MWVSLPGPSGTITGSVCSPNRPVIGPAIAATPRDVIELQRIKVLADAGVPLARVRELLDAEPSRPAGAAAEIDAALRQRIREL